MICSLTKLLEYFQLLPFLSDMVILTLFPPTVALISVLLLESAGVVTMVVWFPFSTLVVPVLFFRIV